jgi:CRP-like cAMP-binding protein
MIADILTGHEIFKLLSPKEIDRVSQLTSEKRFKADEIVYRRAVPTGHFFIILEGTVALVLPGDQGRSEVTVARASKGELIGISPILGHDRYSVRAVAKTDATLLAIEAKPFLALLKDNPVALNGVHAAVARTFYARYLNLVTKLQGVVTQLTSV